jgi:hypothetical protein
MTRSRRCFADNGSPVRSDASCPVDSISADGGRGRLSQNKRPKRNDDGERAFHIPTTSRQLNVRLSADNKIELSGNMIFSHIGKLRSRSASRHQNSSSCSRSLVGLRLSAKEWMGLSRRPRPIRRVYGKVRA